MPFDVDAAIGTDDRRAAAGDAEAPLLKMENEVSAAGDEEDGRRTRCSDPCKRNAGTSYTLQCYTFMDEYRLTIQLVLLGVSIWALWWFVEICVPCIFIIMFVSAFFCFEYRLMNIILWASVIVLWCHGWSFGDRNAGLAVSWK